MDKFLETKLSGFLGFEIPKEMIDHILNLKTEPEIRDYFNGLLDKSEHRQRQFVNEFINKRNLKTPPNKPKNRKKNNKPNTTDNGLYEIKSNFEELEKQYQVATKKEFKNNKCDEIDEGDSINIDTIIVAKNYEKPYEKYKKFVPFDYGQDAYPLLPGRKFCGCFAKHHKLVNNCTECGRLQCEQEGSGPCMHCGTLVVSIDEKAIIESESPEADILVTKLLSQPKPEGWEAAIENQRRLCDADVARKEKQRIIDDQCDYFALTSSVWNDKNDLSDLNKQLKENEEKTSFQKLVNKPKTNVCVITEDEKNQLEKYVNKKQNKPKNNEKEKLTKKKSDGIRFDDQWRLNTVRDLGMVCSIAKIERDVEEFLENLPVMRMPELREKLFYHDPRTDNRYGINYSNEYDWENEFWELNDFFDRLGFCITIRQPYASLIMAGIKTHEGRSWNSDLRGMVWIASAAHQPTEDEIKMVENFYRRKYESKTIKFPKSYPTGRLLGRAQITSWFDHEEYLEKFPNGEVDDPFAIIFDDIIPLPILIPMKGYAGIYLLPKKLHTAAGLMIKKIIQDNPALMMPTDD